MGRSFSDRTPVIKMGKKKIKKKKRGSEGI